MESDRFIVTSEFIRQEVCNEESSLDYEILMYKGEATETVLHVDTQLHRVNTRTTPTLRVEERRSNLLLEAMSPMTPIPPINPINPLLAIGAIVVLLILLRIYSVYTCVCIYSVYTCVCRVNWSSVFVRAEGDRLIDRNEYISVP